MTNATKQNLPVCDACGEGRLHPRINLVPAEHASRTGEIEMRSSVCDVCGSELATPADALANKRARIAFEKHAEGMLTGDEVRAMRMRFGLTQEQSATLFGGGKIAFSRYERDDVAQSSAMDSLLRLCVLNPTNLQLLASMKGCALPAGTIATIQAQVRSAVIERAGQIQKLLDAELAAQRAERSAPASNDSFAGGPRYRSAAAVERKPWSTAA